MRTRIYDWAVAYEPAKFAALLAALATIAGLFGFGQAFTDISAPLNALAAAVAALIVAAQGLYTRKHVYAPATVDVILDEQVKAAEEAASGAYTGGDGELLTDADLEVDEEVDTDEPYYDDDLEVAPRHRVV